MVVPLGFETPLRDPRGLYEGYMKAILGEPFRITVSVQNEQHLYLSESKLVFEVLSFQKPSAFLSHVWDNRLTLLVIVA